jgi:hypothetical protein
MDQPSASSGRYFHSKVVHRTPLVRLGFGDFGVYSSEPFTSTSPLIGDPDVDWSVFENAGKCHPRLPLATTTMPRCALDRYLLRDDSAWITRLSKDFWWNLERISEMITSEVTLAQQINHHRPSMPTQKYNPSNREARRTRISLRSSSNSSSSHHRARRLRCNSRAFHRARSSVNVRSCPRTINTARIRCSTMASRRHRRRRRPRRHHQARPLFGPSTIR